MKSKLFLTVLLLAAITTIGISQDDDIATLENIISTRIDKASKERTEELEEWRKLPYAEMSRALRAGDQRRRAQSLVGLKGIFLRDIYLKEDAKSAGLNEEQLKEVVDLKLSLAGIKVHSLKESHASRDRASIRVGINTTNDDDSPFIVYNICIELNQRVILVGNPSTMVEVTTWGRSRLGHCPKSKFSEVAGRSVRDGVSEFIANYLIANPKK